MSRIQNLNSSLVPALQMPTMAPTTPTTATRPPISKSKPTSPSSPWPNNAKAAISFTMDNLGEAQQVLANTHPSTTPYGQDPSVLTTLPQILALLDKHRIKATYFAEAWSLAHYPSALAALKSRGHELAWHAFQHEVFHSLSEADERLNFTKSWAAAQAAGLTEPYYAGFRPPGGTINGARTFALLQEHGCRYVSPLGTFGVDPATGIVTLPFLWETVDAFWYMDTAKFRAIRAAAGVREAPPFGPGEFKEYLLRKFEEIKREGGYVSVLFHPFLTTDPERLGVLEEVLEYLRLDEEIWVAPCVEVAKWVTEHREDFGFES